LLGLVLVMDVRHPMTKLDKEMLGWFLSTARPFHILLSKSDKLNKDEANIALRHVAETLARF